MRPKYKDMVDCINKAVAERIKMLMLDDDMDKAEKEIKWVNRYLGDVLRC